VEGLQQPHMEDIVEAGPLRMLQTIGHLANALDHLERASVAGAELTLWTALQREGRPVQQAKPDPVTHRELQLAVMSVVVVLGVLTSLEETLADVGEEGVAVAE